MDGVKAMTHQDSPLGTAPVGKLVLQLAIPAMLAQFVNILYSVVDRMYVGHIAEAGAMPRLRASASVRRW